MQLPNNIDVRSENLYSFKKNGFIGYDRDNVVVPFSGTDSEELYNHNLKVNANNPDFARYIEKPVSYVRNSVGHRSCEPESIINNKRPYILVTGCSFTEGTGLAYEETYGALMAAKTDLLVYNLGLAGTGIDTILHNLIAWKNLVRTPPKILVVQWTQGFRTASIETSTNLITGTCNLASPTGKPTDIAKFIDAGLNTGAFTTRAMMAEALIKELYQQSEIVNVHVPDWEVEHYGQNRMVNWRPVYGTDLPPDQARDLQHRGPNGHQDLAKNILKLFNK